jgi:hypothetical protein
MGSYENIVKIEEMRRRMEEGDATAAQRILDTMEIKKIKNMSDLGLIAGVYAENERYEEAIPLYLKIYEKAKTRKSLFQLVNLHIKLGRPEDAEHYLREYEKLASKDFYIYIFRYKIDKLKGEPYETLIETLETLKHRDYMEKWAYELAKTYYKAGMEKECIRECSDIILWFGEGTYVEKAKLLRSYYSGETNKEAIMEELKRRALEDTGNESEAEANQQQEALQESAYSLTAEEETFAGTDFQVAEETVDYENELKKDIQSILTEETWQKDESNSLEEDWRAEDTGRSEEEWLAADAALSEQEWQTAENEQEEQVWQTVEDELTEENSQAEADVQADAMEQTDTGMSLLSSENAQDAAEQEVEEAIYKLLEEEDMDEDDRKLRQLSEELLINLEEIFLNFLHVKSIKKQLVKGLEGILDVHTKTVQLLITGTTGSGKTALAKDITMFLYKTGKLKSSRIAKIKADKLNSIDVMTKKDTLKDCCLVVENASELRRETIDSLLELCRILQGNIAVIFEEDKKNINKLFRECPKLMDFFKNRIHLPGYNAEDLLGFAIACLKQKDYRINSNAEPILKHKIYQIAKDVESHRYLEQINGLMQAAMDAADIRIGKQLSNLASQGRLKDVEVLTVSAEDLVIKP